jgi:hypothetical protein
VSRSDSAVATPTSRPDPRDVRPAHVGDVVVLVLDLADRERHDDQAHLVHVVGDVGPHPLGHHLRLLDDLFDRQLADDAPQVALHDQADQPLALGRLLAQELLGRGLDALRVRLDLDLGDRLDRDRDALAGVQVLGRRDVERHQLERQLLGALDHRQHDRAGPPHDPSAAEAVDDQRLVRPDLAVKPGHDREQEEDDQG